jgi:hypothetical protein
MEEFSMKMIIAILMFAALLASPALAQYGVWRSPYGAYAQQYGAYATYPRYYGYRYSPYNFNVFDTRGHYVGSDPDPRIRSMLARDPPNTD